MLKANRKSWLLMHSHANCSNNFNAQQLTSKTTPISTQASAATFPPRFTQLTMRSPNLCNIEQILQLLQVQYQCNLGKCNRMNLHLVICLRVVCILAWRQLEAVRLSLCFRSVGLSCHASAPVQRFGFPAFSCTCFSSTCCLCDSARAEKWKLKAEAAWSERRALKRRRRNFRPPNEADQTKAIRTRQHERQRHSFEKPAVNCNIALVERRF